MLPISWLPNDFWIAAEWGSAPPLPAVPAQIVRSVGKSGEIASEAAFQPRTTVAHSSPPLSEIRSDPSFVARTIVSSSPNR